MKKTLITIPLITIAALSFWYFDLNIEVRRAWAQVSQRVGVHGITTEIAGQPTWRPIETNDFNIDTEPASQSGLLTQSRNYLFNGTTFERQRSLVIGDGVAATGIAGFGQYLWNGSNFHRMASANDRILNTGGGIVLTSTNIAAVGLMMSDAPNSEWRSLYNARSLGDAATGTLHYSVSGFLYNGATWDRWRSASVGDTAAATGLAAAPTFKFNGSTFDRDRSISATNLTATTSTGSTLNVPLSTWSCTSTPAAATQATCSRPAGGGTVRHVATTVSMCFTDTDSADAATVHLRDGATGAGTILRSWYLHIPAANNSRCQDLSGLAMIGTANTAMTLEFTAAGTANSLETVTLTGFSVP